MARGEETPGGQTTEFEADQPIDESLVAHAERCWQAECENASRLENRSTLIISAIAAIVGIAVYQVQQYHAPDEVPIIRSATQLLAIKYLLLAALAFFAITFLMLFRAYVNLVAWWSGILFLVRTSRYWIAFVVIAAFDEWAHGRRLSSKEPRLIAVAKQLVAVGRPILKKGKKDHPNQPEFWNKAFQRRSSHYLSLPQETVEDLPQNADDARRIVFARVYSAYLDLVAWNDRKAKQVAGCQTVFLAGFVMMGAAIAVYLYGSR